jgi:hypothetical protein
LTSTRFIATGSVSPFCTRSGYNAHRDGAIGATFRAMAALAL